jgi:hypothetical protein
MTVYHYVFQYKGFTVEYRIMARSLRVANAIARVRDRAWQQAIDAREQEGALWS